MEELEHWVNWMHHGFLGYGFLALIGHQPARLFAEATAGRTSLLCGAAFPRNNFVEREILAKLPNIISIVVF
jgi:hypothetical protein